MVLSIRNNKLHAINCRDIRGVGCMLLPGITTDVPDTARNALKEHPVLKAYIEYGVIEILTKEPTVRGESEELTSGSGKPFKLKLTDDKRTEEPSPVISLNEQDALFKNSAKPKKEVLNAIEEPKAKRRTRRKKSEEVGDGEK